MAGGFSFADGHSEIKAWKDGRTCPPVKLGQVQFSGNNVLSVPNDVDVAWLQDHTTRPK
jgi:hypothetical protein